MMDLKTILDITLIANLASSVINVFAYGFGYFRVSKTKVDGKLKLTKRTLLFEFITVLIVTILLAFVYQTVIFDPEHTTQALYLLNFTLLFFNIAFNINAVLLAVIAETNAKNQ